MRQGSPQRGGLILKKGVVVDRRTFTTKNYCSLFLQREVQYNWSEKTLHKDSLEVLVSSRSL